MDHIATLDLDVVGVHPINKFFFWVEFLQNFMLLSAVMPLKLAFPDVLFEEELGLISQAGQGYLIPAQVHQRVGEKIEHLREDLAH